MKKEKTPVTGLPSNFDPHSSDFVENPYPVYKWFRENEPIVWVEKNHKSFWVFRHEDVKNILNEPDLWVKEIESESRLPKLRKSLFASDGTRHDELRKLLGPLFRKSTEDLAETASIIARDLASRLTAEDSFNFIPDFAHPLPSRVLAHVLGIREQAWSMVEQLAETIIRANDPTLGLLAKGKGGASMLALRAGILGLLEIPGEIEEDKMIGLMAKLSKQSEGTDVDFTIEDVAANAASLAIAGYFTTTHVMGTGLVNLLNHHDSLATLQVAIATRNHQELMQGMVGEMLRFDAPIHVLDRFANETTKIGEVVVQKGQKIAAVIGSANRDGDVFNNPDTFDIARDTRNLLSFGYGVHQCLGAQMLRQILPIALETILSTLPTIKISESPIWQKDPYFRGYSELMFKY